jgi:hypothetical protein
MSAPAGEVDEVVTGTLAARPLNERSIATNGLFVCLCVDVIKLVDDSAAVGDDTINAILRVCPTNPCNLHGCIHHILCPCV